MTRCAVADYDRILVLDNGHVAEFGSPKELLAIPDGHYARLVREASSAGRTSA